MRRTLLKVSALESRYGGIVALKGIDFEVHAGEVISVIGANGAGKTTLLKSIVGQVHREAGRIEFDGADIASLPTTDIVKRGIALVPEGRQVFGPMTVEENLRMGGYLVRRDSAHIRKRFEVVYDLFPRLRERRVQRAETLSGGEQQMLAIGRALMGDPKLLLIDELSLGLAPVVVHDLYRRLMSLRSEKLTMVIVEQNARIALSACDRAYVLSTGTVMSSGHPSELLADDAVLKAYLS